MMLVKDAHDPDTKQDPRTKQQAELRRRDQPEDWDFGAKHDAKKADLNVRTCNIVLTSLARGTTRLTSAKI